MFVPRTFAEVLKEIRKDNGWSQEELAQKLGTSKQVISRYETEQRVPKITTVSDYAKALGVTLEYLLGVDSKDAYRANELMRSGEFRELEKLIGLPENSIQPLSEDEKQKANEWITARRKEENRLFWLLKHYINTNLPNFSQEDLEDIELYIDVLAAKKRKSWGL